MLCHRSQGEASVVHGSVAVCSLSDGHCFSDERSPGGPAGNKITLQMNASATHYIGSEPHLLFQHRNRPTSFQAARGLSRSAQKKYSCTEGVFLFRQTGMGSRPTHSGSHGKSRHCVQRTDWTSDHWYCLCRPDPEQGFERVCRRLSALTRGSHRFDHAQL